MRRPSSDRLLPLSVSAVLGAVLLSAAPLQGGGFDAPPQVSSGAQARPQVQGRPLAMDDLVAWCIVPFDSRKRTPEERIAMLERLGFKRYAYDWRAEHLPDTARELRLAREHGIRVEAVWLWIDAAADRPGKLSDGNERLLAILAEAGLSTQIWVGFAPNYFEGRPDEEKVARGVEMVRYLSERAAETRSRVALCNHGDWFGEPENQIRIIQALPGREIGLVLQLPPRAPAETRGPEDLALRHGHPRAEDAAGRPRLGTHGAVRRPRPRGRCRRRGDPARQPAGTGLHAELTIPGVPNARTARTGSG